MKKNAWLSPVLSATLAITAGLSPEVMAQFEKYKSKTKFNKSAPPMPSSGSSTANESAVQDSGKSAKALLQDTTNFAPGDDEGEGEDGDIADSESADGDSSSESRSSSRDTFGRSSNKSVKPNKIEKKYVDLNPETAFLLLPLQLGTLGKLIFKL